MEATASTPIAVASVSPTNVNTRTIYSNNTSPDSRNLTTHTLTWPTMTYDLHNMPSIPSNRPVTSASASNNVPAGPINSNTTPDSINMAAFPPIRPVNSAPESKNVRRSPNHTSSASSSPRRRRINVEQHINDRTKQNVPQPLNIQNSQNAHKPHHNQNGENSEDLRNLNPQAAQLLQSLQNANVKSTAQAPIVEPLPGRVLVTGYPTYTQPHDILELFTKFGNVRIDKCNSFSATLTYPTEDQAKKAIQANKRLHIYGHFLAVRPYSAKLNAAEGPMSPKREFIMTKQKSVIIEPEKIDLSGDFSSQLEQIMAAIRLNQEEINKISTLYKDLETAFQSQWPGCKAIPFGSITTGLGIKTSDADCFISLPPQYRLPHGNHVNKARRLLTLNPQIFTEILAIPRANTPIVKFYHVPTDINCDLTFKTPLGAQNSRLVAFLLQSDPRITPMAVVIKYWAKVHDLSGTGKLTNYALTLMIIFFLQQPPYSMLPSVEWLQRDRANDIIVDWWNTGYMNNVALLPRSTNKSTIPELIGGFFEYYASFDFDNLVVCPFIGTSIKKVAFMETETLPDEFSLYKCNVLNNYVMPIRYQTPFCVQDPFEQCHNVASTITSKLATDIITFFKFAAAAYKTEKSNNYAGLLRGILLEKPKIDKVKPHPEYRVNLFPRIINMIISGEWKDVIRNLVKTLFEKMIKVKLEKVDEKINPETKKEKERYTGSLTKPVWKRKKYRSLYMAPNMTIEEKQAVISEEIIKRDIEKVNLQFQLLLTFCNDPKSAVISIRMSGGDLEAFREFGKFFMSVMQSWFTELLRPYSKPNCSRTSAAKIALSVDPGGTLNNPDSDDEDEEDAVTPSTNPSPEKTTEHKISANIPREETTEHKISANILPEEVTEHKISTNISPEETTEHKISANIPPEETTEHKISANISPEETTDHKISANIPPEETTEHKISANISPEETTEHKISANISPEETIEHKISANISPEETTDHKISANISPEETTEHEISANISPEETTEHKISANISPEETTEHKISANISPEETTEHEISANISPEETTDHKISANISPEETTEHKISANISELASKLANDAPACQ